MIKNLDPFFERLPPENIWYIAMSPTKMERRTSTSLVLIFMWASLNDQLAMLGQINGYKQLNSRSKQENTQF
jgi:hypothetical protein